KNHTRIRLRLATPGTAVAAIINNNWRIVVDDPGKTRLWDCPPALLNGKAECTVYTAPGELPHAPASINDTECGIVVTRAHRTWLVRRNAGTQDIFDADGIAGCREGEILAYTRGHIAYLTPKREPVTRSRQTAQLERIE